VADVNPDPSLTLAPSPLRSGREALLAGDPHAAAAILERVVAADPADIEAHYWLASARFTAVDPRAAETMEQARTLHALIQARIQGADLSRCQTDPAYAADIATQFYAQHLMAVSGVVRRLGLSAGGVDAFELVNYGLALQHQGRVDEACEVFRVVADHFPSPAGHQFLIQPQLFRDDGDARHSAAAREWAKIYASDVPTLPHTNPDLRGRKLRIGYVAPWFAKHQLQQFITPLLESHDPEAVSVTLYPTDAESETEWPSWIDVHPLGDLDDAQAAALIRRDGIDVLADCWGHAANSRLPVFAHRPAPVQVAWINFIQTTGLEQIDYVLHADTAGMTPAMASLYTEDIWRIGPVFAAFRPAADRLPPAPTPAYATGCVTFGSFNHPAKLSGSALDAWAAILRGAPTSRLLLKYRYFIDPVLQRVTRARFAARGVAPERIVYSGHTTGEAYFHSFRQVDLMLDTWPAPGSTTTLEALSNGVPVLVMAEPNLAGLYARSILEASGLTELVTSSPDRFVALALELAADPQRLDALRARVRPAFENGTCCDEVGFTRRIEAAFGQMFERWQRRAAA
jgi:protein O-GlcNAc transferase